MRYKGADVLRGPTAGGNRQAVSLTTKRPMQFGGKREWRDAAFLSHGACQIVGSEEAELSTI